MPLSPLHLVLPYHAMVSLPPSDAICSEPLLLDAVIEMAEVRDLAEFEASMRRKGYVPHYDPIEREVVWSPFVPEDYEDMEVQCS